MSDKLREEQPKDILGRPITPTTTGLTNCPLESKPFECVCCKRLTAENAKLVEVLTLTKIELEYTDRCLSPDWDVADTRGQDRAEAIAEARSALERSDEP